jgi:hypothetical protein
VHDAKVVAVSDCLKNLLNDGGRLLFRKLNFCDNLIKQLSTFAQLSNEIISFLIFKNLIQFENIRMVQFFEDGNLMLETLLLLTAHGLLLDEFNRPCDLGLPIETLPDLSESALAQQLPNLIVVLEFAVI